MSSPYINRFLQPDTIIPDPSNPQSWNRYSYVSNNPVNFNDPTGHAQENDDDGGDYDPNYCNTHPSECVNPDNDLEEDLETGGGGDNEITIGPIPSPACASGGMYNCPPTPPTVMYPSNVTLHPLDGNVVSQVPIYDYSRNPPKIIGYKTISYAIDRIHVNPANYFIPSDSLTWTSFLWSRVKPLLMPGARNLASIGIVISCPECEIGLTVIATIDSLNSAITLDAHLRTHIDYIPKPVIPTPFDDLYIYLNP